MVAKVATDLILHDVIRAQCIRIILELFWDISRLNCYQLELQISSVSQARYHLFLKHSNFLNCPTANCIYNFGHSNFLLICWNISTALGKKHLKTVSWAPYGMKIASILCSKTQWVYNSST